MAGDAYTNIATRVDNVDANSAVDINTLMANIRLGAIRAWSTSTAYTVGHKVRHGYTEYLCVTAHTSGTFSDDFVDSLHWVPQGDYPGCIKIHPVTDKIPADFMEIDGDAILRATYDVAYKILGVIYGAGDGSTTFNLPDTEANGSFIRHYKSGTSAAIATLQNHAFQGHRHAELAGSSYLNSNAAANGANGVNITIGTVSTTGDPITDGSHGAVNATSSETRPTNMAMIYIIKVL